TWPNRLPARSSSPSSTARPWATWRRWRPSTRRSRNSREGLRRAGTWRRSSLARRPRNRCLGIYAFSYNNNYEGVSGGATSGKATTGKEDMPYGDVNDGLQLYYEDFGDGPPIVFTA